MKDFELNSICKPQSQQKVQSKVKDINLDDKNSTFEGKLYTSTQKIKSKKNFDDFFAVNINQFFQYFQLEKISVKEFFVKKDVSVKLIESNNSSNDNNKNIFENNIKEKFQDSNRDLDKNNPTISTKQKVLSQFIEYINNYGIPISMVDFSNFLLARCYSSKIENIKDIAEQIIENAHLIKIKGKTELILNLKSEWLGEIKINIKYDNGTISIQIFASSLTREIFESQIDELKNLLTESNLSIGSINVSLNEKGHNNEKFVKNDENFEDIQNLSYEQLFTNYTINQNFANMANLAINFKKLLVYSKV